MHTEVKSSASARDRRVGVIVSRYHQRITDALREAAVETFIRAGGAEDDLLIAHASGAFEIPVLAKAMLERGDLDAIVALGCIITGETPHDRYIAQAVSSALTALTIEHGTPIAFGVLTCQTMAQAKARSGGPEGNKGEEAMIAAIEAVNTLHAIRQRGGTA